MALPKLQTPEYKLVIPSTQEEIKFRAIFGQRAKDFDDCSRI
jgi:hypothetical protein